jgi:hypothetical protein
MDRISGVLWVVAGAGIIATFLPGAQHIGTPWVLRLAAFVLAYGVGSRGGWIAWDPGTSVGNRRRLDVTLQRELARRTLRPAAARRTAARWPS